MRSTVLYTALGSVALVVGCSNSSQGGPGQATGASTAAPTSASAAGTPSATAPTTPLPAVAPVTSTARSERAYLLSSGSVRVLDPATDQELASVQLPLVYPAYPPHELVAGPGDRVYVFERPGSFHTLDTQTNQVSARTVLPQFWTQAHDARRVHYVPLSSGYGFQLRSYDLETGGLLGTVVLPAPGQPGITARILTVPGRDEVLVLHGDPAGTGVHVVDPVGGVVLTTFTTPALYRDQTALSPDGRTVLSFGANTVYGHDPLTGQQQFATQLPEATSSVVEAQRTSFVAFDSARGLAYLPRETLVAQLNLLSGLVLNTIPFPGTGSPKRAVVDPAGVLYVCDAVGTVLRATPRAGGFDLDSLSLPAGDAKHLTLAAAQNTLYVAHHNAIGRVDVVDLTTFTARTSLQVAPGYTTHHAHPLVLVR